MNLAWKFQIPVILLSDKHLSESTFSASFDETRVELEVPKLWSGEGEYKRYTFTEDGISPLTFPGIEKAIVKASSYEHDEFGITVEQASLVAKAHEKRLRKMKTIEEYLKTKETVKVYGNEDSNTVIVTWGSTKGAVVEAAERLGLKVVQPLYLMPLPVWELEKHLNNAERVISVEVNSTAQLCKWLRYNGLKVDEHLLKYDGRPFAVDELEEKLRKVLKV
jgi:2-oxoglutarate ferredoxin oxidoreductase subunit alpha